MYPDVVLLSQMESYHEDYIYYKDVWEQIAELRIGAPAVLRNPAKYLKQKPGEEKEVYEARLAKATFTPVFSYAIKSFVTNLEDAPLHLDIDDSEVEFWNQFRDAVNGKRLKDRDWLIRTFSSLLYFGRHFVGVDLPQADIKAYSILEVERLNLVPYLADFEPLQVIDYEPDVWYKTRQIIFVSSPLEGRVPYLRYTLWGTDENAVYEAEVKISNPLGTVSRSEEVDILLKDAQRGTGQLQVGIYTVERIRTPEGRWTHPTDPLLTLRKTRSLAHGIGKPTMAYLELPNELWTGKDIAPKQIQHMNIESSWTDSGVLAGTMQRLFSPADAAPMNDTRYSYEQPNADNLKLGNPYVLIGKDYKIVESTGEAISNLTLQLDKITTQIEMLVNLQFASGKPTGGVIEQSGKSKEIDRGLLKKTLQTYGTHLIALYQYSMDIVATLKGKQSVTVSGLDTFESNTIDTALSQTTLLNGLTTQPPATAMKIWYSKLCELMTGDISDEDREAIAKELEEMFKPEEEVVEGEETGEVDLEEIATTFGVDVEELSSLLGVE